MGVKVGDSVVSITQLQEIPVGKVVLLVGPPGSGKSTFSEQSVLQNLTMEKSIIYVTTERPPHEVEKELRDRGLGEVEPGLLNYVDAYNETVGLPTSERPNTVRADSANLSSLGMAISKLQERIGKKDILLIFDSLTSPYLLSGPEVVRFLRLTLARFAGEGNGVLACMDEGCGKQEDLGAMMSISNGVIEMETREDRQFLNIVKHPKLKPTIIEAPKPEPIKLEECVFNPDVLARYIRNMREMRDEAVFRREV